MAKTAATAYHPTDADLDELVNAEIADMGQGAETPAPGASAPAVASDDEDDEPDELEPAAQPGADDDEEDPDDVAASAPAGEDDEDAEASAPASAAPAPAPAPVAAGEPFQFKASGGVHTLSGARLLADGSVVIAPAALPDFKRLLSSERELARQLPTLQRQLAAKDTEHKAALESATAEAKAMQDYVAELLAMSPDDRWAAINALETDIPKLQAEVRQKTLDEREKRLAERERGPQPTPEEQEQAVVAAITTEMKTSYERLRLEPDAKVLTKAEFDEVFRKWMGKLDRLVIKAPKDDPATGVKKGDLVFDESELIEDLNLLVRLKKANGGAPAGAAARNAALSADTANVIPPAPRQAPVPGTPARRKMKKMDPRSFRTKFMAGELDDSDE